MTVRVGAPDLRHDGRLVWPVWEDAVTASYELVRQLALPAGTAVAAHNVTLPPWWWTATGLDASPRGRWHVVGIDGEHGEAVAVTDDEGATVLPTLVRALASARRLSADEHRALVAARDPSPRASDFPLGAHVTPRRHAEVLLARLRIPEATVRTWTRVAPGAGPAEFQRLQDAHGAYHVVLVAWDGGQTVGIWNDPTPPATGQTVRPVLRRTHRDGAAWRYQVGFAPTL